MIKFSARAYSVFFIFNFLLNGPMAFSDGKIRKPTNPCLKKYPNIDATCQQVCAACFQANFVVGEAKIGDGFWGDCVSPIVTGRKPKLQPSNDGHGIPVLPTGLESIGAACLAKSGVFWKNGKKK